MVTPDFNSWLQYGIDEGFCGPVYCQNHDVFSHADSEEYNDYAEKDDFNFDFCWAVVHIHEGVNG
tara:strand:+ start:318 stop:512 length:195 start_codon:yes stop_codon:yes gene_type:complete